ncbi:MAG: copper chaperone PCu(A)C [Burkholderiaceae bacterium]
MNAFLKTLIQGMTSVALLIAATSAPANGSTLGDIGIEHPYSVPTPAGATTGAAYIKELSNKGKTDDKLVSASSPLADHVELHTMSMDGDIMRMRAVPGIPLPAGGHVDMAPGNGYHLMMIGIKQPFKVGDKIPLTLKFEKAGTVDVEVHVQERGAASDMHMH